MTTMRMFTALVALLALVIGCSGLSAKIEEGRYRDGTPYIIMAPVPVGPRLSGLTGERESLFRLGAVVERASGAECCLLAVHYTRFYTHVLTHDVLPRFSTVPDLRLTIDGEVHVLHPEAEKLPGYFTFYSVEPEMLWALAEAENLSAALVSGNDVEEGRLTSGRPFRQFAERCFGSAKDEH